MDKLSIGQKRILAEYLANTAVAWLSAGVVTPFFMTKTIENFILFSIWGLIFSLIFLIISLIFAERINS